MTAVGALGWIVAFVQVLELFSALAAVKKPSLTGADAALSFPVALPALGFFALVAAVGVAGLAGAHWVHWFSLKLLVLTTAAVVFFGWAIVAGFTVFVLLEFLLAAAALAVAILWRDNGADVVPAAERRWALGGFLVLAGVAGWTAAFALTADKIQTLTDPGSALSCNFSLVVQCGANLASAQGSAFGFPNPVIGLGGFLAPFIVGLAIMAGARFRPWFWIAFNIGLAGALAFVIWLIVQSIFFLGTLCPWCMLVWSVTIPSFLLVTFFNFKQGHFPVSARAQRRFSGLYTYVPFITVACYLVVAVIAQLRLDVISYL